MKQIFAIFLKDVRHLWPEILASLSVVAALVFTYPHQWRSGAYGDVGSTYFFGHPANGIGFVASCLILLVPVSWLVLIARMVHTERLVGNTQFWLTRPYEWPKFLAAKTLFLACFLYAPFLFAQCILLAEAGFRPLSYVHGLFFNLLFTTCFLVLPFLALSSATPSFGKLTLVVLGVLLFIAGVAVVYSALPSDFTYGGANRLSDLLGSVFFLCACGAVVFVQYARRRTRLAWLLIGVTAFLMAAFSLVEPDRWFMDRYYPGIAAGSNAPLQLALVTNDKLRQPHAEEAEDRRDVQITVPVQLSGIPNEGAVLPRAIKASVITPGGVHWHSQWQAIYGINLLPDAAGTALTFRIRRAVYDQFKSAPVTLELSLAVDEARATATNQLPVQVGELPVPGVGICKMPGYAYFMPGFINCRSAMRQPPLTYVTGHWTDGVCPAQPTDAATILGSGWVGDLDNDPAEFGITSVWQFSVPLTNQWENYRYDPNKPPRRLCPGSLLTFTSYQPVSTEQLKLMLTDFHLPALSSGMVELLSR